jgi:putative addiction module component (TIGR02574 family)
MSIDPDINGLSPAECILLAERLWEQARIHAEAVPITDAQRDELKRRVAALDSGEMAPGEPWEAVRDRLFPR